MWKNREKIAKILFIIFLFSLVVSLSFILCLVDHNCIGEGCNICYEITLMKSFLDNLLILVIMYISIKIIGSNKIKNIIKIKHNLTLVKLKVKLLE